MAARTHLVEALTLASADGPRFVVALALEELGVQAVRQGRAEHGVQLLSASALVRRDSGTPIRTADRSAVEDALAVAYAALGDVTYADAQASGQAWPLEHIVAHLGDEDA
jgi:hypothetical protein